MSCSCGRGFALDAPGVSVSERCNKSKPAIPSERQCAIVLLLGLFGFTGFTGLAMWLYPGGNWLDRSAPGHRFFANFFCDLTQPVSLSGVDNARGAFFAQLGMLLFALSLWAFFWLLPWHFAPARRVTRWVRGLGLGAVLSLAAVTLMPSERFGQLHGWLALASGALGIAAALSAVVTLARSQGRARSLGILGTLVLALGTLDGCLFASHLGQGTPLPWLVPAAQKIVALLLCAWMVGVAWPALGRRERELSPHR